ncbi:MAG: peptidyl-prolyl cis-trans isomerase [Odoribacter sp.]|nr:peptidyl-prolyl cis-trans isomerase [Odoribacter sp.]
MKLTILSVIAIALLSCQQNASQQTPVAQVFESVLYQSDIAPFIPKGTSSEDSILMAKNYIRNWVTQKLLLHKAIENLPSEELHIRKLVEDYRQSLIIHQYKQKLIEQRLEDDISDEEIKKYYTEHENNFILATPIVKAVFFILPQNTPNLKEVRQWFNSDKATDQESLEDYCLTHARKFDKFYNQWTEAKFLLNLMPGDYKTLNNSILSQKNIEREDKGNRYFLKIREMRKEQTIAPLEYVRNEITLILKNKKKLQFESELEKQINQEGIEKKYVKIY